MAGVSSRRRFVLFFVVVRRGALPPLLLVGATPLVAPAGATSLRQERKQRHPRQSRASVHHVARSGALQVLLLLLLLGTVLRGSAPPGVTPSPAGLGHNETGASVSVHVVHGGGACRTSPEILQYHSR